MAGKYRLERPLGEGGMAEVFVATALGEHGWEKEFALKRILKGFSDNATFAQSFITEARLSAKLVHPNVVSVTDFSKDDHGRLLLVMELVRGVDLDALARTGPLPMPVIVTIITDVLRGLGFAHSFRDPAENILGIVHRDVSPQNVLIGWDGGVKVSDFGIAKARAATEATASVFVRGKPAYMSPEQANGRPLDGRSDLFAVGVMLWELLCGESLFAGDSAQATLARVMFEKIRRPRSLRSSVTPDLERVTMRLLERDLDRRYATAEQALTALESCKDAIVAGRAMLIEVLKERFPWRAPGALPQVSQPAEKATIELSQTVPPAPSKSVRKRTFIAPGARARRARIVGIVAAGAVITALVFMIFASGDDQALPEPSLTPRDAVAQPIDAAASPALGPTDASARPDATLEPDARPVVLPPRRRATTAPSSPGDGPGIYEVPLGTPDKK